VPGTIYRAPFIFSLHRLCGGAGRESLAEQAVVLVFDHLVALADRRFEAAAVEYCDVAAHVLVSPCSCSRPAAAVTPSRLTPSMLAISSCVISSSCLVSPHPA